MKKLFLVLAAAFAMVACQTDINEVGVAGGEVDVTFEVGTPTRAYSDGTTATVLQYAVYEVVDKDNEGTAEILTPLTVTNGEIHGSTTVNLQLVTGNTYAVVFWAAAEGAPYTVDFGRTLDEATMTVNYDADKTFCNDEKRDAFFKKHVFTVKGAQTETIELRRPFAQLNIGTNDYTASAEAGYTPVKSYVEVAAYNTLKLATGVVENQATRVFNYANIKEENKVEKFPVDGYEYLAMNYLLVAADDETVDVKFGYTETDENAAKTRIVGSVPVKRNYRTNIYGQLLTSNVDINVEIKPEYEQPNYNQEWAAPWSGEADTTWYKETDSNGNPITEFIIVTPEQLAGLADLVDGGNTFEGKTIKLGINLDLSSASWDGIGDGGTGTAFKGTFDGQDHIIYGAYFQDPNQWNGNLWGDERGLGIFSRVDGATIKNINLDSENFACYTIVAGGVAAYANNTTFENIKISNTMISSYNWNAGGVVGYAEGTCIFKGIEIDEKTVVGSLWDSYGTCSGGIAGEIKSDSKITIEDCTISCVLDVINDVTSNYKWWIYRVAGMLIGETNDTDLIFNTVVDVTARNVECKNVTVNYGDWMNYHYCQGYGQRGWVRVEESGYIGGIDHTQCNHPAGESHYVCVPLDQLFGGSSNGTGHYPARGLAEFPGVTVNYPASYVRGVSSLADISKAVDLGIKQVALEADLDAGSTQLALNGLQVDLGGHTLTTNMTFGGIALKNGASIKNGTIEHTTTVAAIKAYNVGSIENVTIKNTCATAGKTVTGIAIQQGGHVGSIKNVKFEGVSQAIEVGYQATVDLIEDVEVYGKNNGTAQGIGLVINGGKVGKAVNSTFKGDSYGVKMLLKGVFAVGLELEGCTVEGTTASIAAYDEKGISNTSGSLVLTYDAATTLTGPFVWDFEDECQSVVTLNQPQ